MIIKILKGDTIEGPLKYNFQKEGREVATVLCSENMPVEPTFQNACRYFSELSEMNGRCRKPVFTVSINPSEADLRRLSDENLKEFAREYMNGMGYGGQPYIVFKHEDIERTHIHIVTVRVDHTGKVISDKFEQKRSSQLRRSLEVRYSLDKAEEIGERNRTHERISEKVESLPVDKMTEKDKRSKIRAILRFVKDRYKPQSMAELNKILRLYRLKAETVNEGTQMAGVLFSITDKNGEKAIKAIKGSSIGKGFSYAEITSFIEKNSKEKKNTKDIARKIEKWMKGCTNIAELSELLKADGIETITTVRKNGDISGITFIDTVKGTVAKGSEVDRRYSALNLIKSFDKNRKDSRVGDDDFKKAAAVLSKFYSERRKNTDKYYYESELVSSLKGMKAEMIERLSEEKSLSHISDIQKLRITEGFVKIKESKLKDIKEKESIYFNNICRQFCGYLLKLETPEKRASYLAALGLKADGDNIRSIRNRELYVPMQSFGITPSDLITTSDEKHKQLGKFERAGLLNTIEGYYEPAAKYIYSLKNIITDKDFNELSSIALKEEVKKVFATNEDTKRAIEELMESGIIIVPAKTREGETKYYAKYHDSNEVITDTSDLIKEEMDKIDYTNTVLPNIYSTIYNKWGRVNPSYKAVTRACKASKITNMARRESELIKIVSWCESFSPLTAETIKDKYLNNQRKNVAKEKLSHGRKI